MDTKAPTVAPDATVEDIVKLLGDHDVPGVTVVDGDNRVLGIITESDLVFASEEGDLHLPHYIELFGGIVYLEPLKKYHARLKKAVAEVAIPCRLPVIRVWPMPHRCLRGPMRLLRM